MKKLSLLFWLILSGLCHLNLLQAQHVSQKDEFETLMQKIRQDFAQNPDITQGLEKYNAQDGSFTDGIMPASSVRTGLHWHISTAFQTSFLLIPIPKTDTIRMRICIIR